MKADPNILKQFYTVLNREALTREIYDKLVDRWGFSGMDLEEEQRKINQKKSTLSKSQRDSVKEFLLLKKMLESQEAQKTSEISFGNDDMEQPISNDQISFN